MSQFTDQIKQGTWAELKADAKAIREQVFIIEQNISPEDEWDEQDPISLHFILYREGQAIATARLLADNSIGRVAVLKAYRGLGLGLFIMQAIIAEAQREGRSELHLSAQVHAVEFYRALGFEQQGEVYLDCNIPHITMSLAF